jgi:hypothetical protein
MVKIDPRTGELLEKEFVAHRDKNPVWDAETGTVTLTGSRNEFVAFQIAVESSEPIAKLGVTVTRPLFSGVRLPAVFERAGAVHVYREWFVPDDRNRWYPDALIPASDPLALPSSDNPVPGQRVQPFFVDVYIPHSAKPGPHAGAIQVAGREIRLVANVLPLTLPDRLNFIVDLNCYSGVPARAQRGTPEYRKIEQAYHRVAHLHRTNLDVLGYSHNGTTVADHAPPLTGEGKATKIADWGAWDDHFGGLLDGSAFRDLPRSSVPVPAMYLPFFENWPGDLRASYKYPFNAPARTEEEYQQIITRHALEAPPVEEAFSQAYQDRYSAVVVDFARHLRERKWTRTNYLVYFNNKYYYKRPSQGGRGISWWLMDEPNHRDDVRASAFLGWLTERWLGDYQDVPILFRTDISRVEWIRDLMAGQIDLNCISKRFFEKNRYLLDDRVRFGREYWNYASTNHPRESNVAMRAWCWRVWLNGGNGLLPWNAVRGDESWNRAEPLTVFYPGAKFGQDEPFASLRLKAYRRGQQDIEYLILLAEKQGWGRDAVARAVAQALDLSGGITQTHEDDAGAVAFSSVNDSSLDEVRLRIARALERH